MPKKKKHPPITLDQAAHDRAVYEETHRQNQARRKAKAGSPAATGRDRYGGRANTTLIEGRRGVSRRRHKNR